MSLRTSLPISQCGEFIHGLILKLVFLPDTSLISIFETTFQQISDAAE